MELKGKRINFLGDSITEGHGTSDWGTKPYHQLLRVRCELAEARNYGLGGTKIARLPVITEHQFDQDFNLRAEKMNHDADAVVVFGGTNDFGHGTIPLGDMDSRDIHTFYGGLHYLMSGLIEKYPEAVIVFATPLHRGGDTNSRNGRPNLKGFRDMILEVAEYYSIPVLDLWSMSGISTNSKTIVEKYIPDSLHPNDAGHVILADRIIGFLQAL